jgi:NADH dehydrogenase
VAGHPEIFVLGDCALARDGKGKPLPGLAPVAKQQGEHVGRVLSLARKKASRQGQSGAARPVFAYKDYGALATVGRKVAIADFGTLKLKGFAGWLAWSLVHIYFLIGFRNRFSVALDWAWSYLTFQRGARLITGPVDEVRRPARTDGATRRAA